MLKPPRIPGLSPEVYFQTAYDMWLGKFIGGTLGASFEGFKQILDVDVAQMLPLEIVENDDTDLQVLWLHALEEHGIHLNSSHLMREWREHVRAPWGEYGIAMANWERGIMPPESGMVDNWFYENGMGCPIRSEIWGIICPGLPERAAVYARHDAQLDHGSESIQAEVFLAALEAQVFLEKDLDRLIETGMKQVDLSSRFARLVPDVIAWSADHSWKEVRTRILRDYGHPDFTNSLQNMGFTLLALLQGEGDFIRAMDIAIGCGYDTDCTAATAAAILNAMQGSDALPDSVREAVADTYLVSPWMHGFPSSGSLKELTRSCCRFGREVLAAFGQDRDILADDSENGTESRPLAVVPQEVPPIDPVDKPFPDWIVLGPFFRDWTEIVAQHEVYPDHGLPALPSTRYMTLMHSGFDLEVLDAAAVTTSGLLPEDRTGALVRTIRAVDSRLDLHRGIESNGPGTFYAYSEFDSPDAGRNWLLVGSTGPVEVWINGACILKSDTFQPLAPTTLEAEITLLSGLNRIMLKLERASQPVEAFVQFKVHADRHWHQCFLNTALNWRELVE